MFFSGLTPLPDVSHDLSDCLTGLELVPSDTSFLINNLRLCGTNYSIDTEFLSQAELLTFLNGVFNDTYEYTGVWTIESNHLIYTSDEVCYGTSCLNISNFLMTDRYINNTYIGSTITLPNVANSIITFSVNGSVWTQGTDFTIVGALITLINPITESSIINILYDY